MLEENGIRKRKRDPRLSKGQINVNQCGDRRHVSPMLRQDLTARFLELDSILNREENGEELEVS